MKTKRWLVIAALLVLCAGMAALFNPLSGAAQGPDQVYGLSWWTVDGGGGTSGAAGHYSLDGTAGQPDPGPLLTGDNYQVAGGFWSGGGLSGVSWHAIYLPMVLRGHP